MACGRVCASWTDDEIGTAHDFAAVIVNFTRDKFERRRFAGAVAADQTHAFTRLDREIGIGEYGLVSKIETDLIETQQ